MLNRTESNIYPEVELVCIERRNDLHVGWFLVQHTLGVVDLRYGLSDVIKPNRWLVPATSTDFNREHPQLLLALTHPLVQQEQVELVFLV